MKRSKECWQQQDSDLGSWTRFFKTQILEYACMLRDTIIKEKMIIQERGRIWQEVDFLSKIPTLLPPCLKIPSVSQVFRAVVLSPVQRLALASGSQTLACVRMTYSTFKNTTSPASRISDSVGLE